MLGDLFNAAMKAVGLLRAETGQVNVVRNSLIIMPQV